MKQKLILTFMAVFLVFGFLAGSLMTLASLPEADAGVWHGINCTVQPNGTITCDSIEWHGYSSH